MFFWQQADADRRDAGCTQKFHVKTLFFSYLCGNIFFDEFSEFVKLLYNRNVA